MGGNLRSELIEDDAELPQTTFNTQRQRMPDINKNTETININKSTEKKSHSSLQQIKLTPKILTVTLPKTVYTHQDLKKKILEVFSKVSTTGKEELSNKITKEKSPIHKNDKHCDDIISKRKSTRLYKKKIEVARELDKRMTTRSSRKLEASKSLRYINISESKQVIENDPCESDITVKTVPSPTPKANVSSATNKKQNKDFITPLVGSSINLIATDRIATDLVNNRTSINSPNAYLSSKLVQANVVVHVENIKVVETATQNLEKTIKTATAANLIPKPVISAAVCNEKDKGTSVKQKKDNNTPRYTSHADKMTAPKTQTYSSKYKRGVSIIPKDYKKYSKSIYPQIDKRLWHKFSAPHSYANTKIRERASKACGSSEKRNVIEILSQELGISTNPKKGVEYGKVDSYSSNTIANSKKQIVSHKNESSKTIEQKNTPKPQEFNKNHCDVNIELAGPSTSVGLSANINCLSKPSEDCDSVYQTIARLQKVIRDEERKLEEAAIGDSTTQSTTLGDLLENSKQNNELKISESTDNGTEVIIEVVDHSPLKPAVTRMSPHAGNSTTNLAVKRGNQMPNESIVNKKKEQGKPFVRLSKLPVSKETIYFKNIQANVLEQGNKSQRANEDAAPPQRSVDSIITIEVPNQGEKKRRSVIPRRRYFHSMITRRRQREAEYIDQLDSLVKTIIVKKQKKPAVTATVADLRNTKKFVEISKQPTETTINKSKQEIINTFFHQVDHNDNTSLKDQMCPDCSIKIERAISRQITNGTSSVAVGKVLKRSIQQVDNDDDAAVVIEHEMKLPRPRHQTKMRRTERE